MYTVYLKPTNQCNLRCQHCFIPDEQKEEALFMPEEYLDRIKEKLPYLAPVHVVFHGGECTLAGVDFFWNAYEKFKESAYRFSIQTNLLCINNDWINFIKNVCDGRLGTSYDYKIRFYGKYEKLYDVWLEKIRFLLGNDIWITVNITLTKLLYNEGVEKLFEIINEFRKLGIKEFHLERFTPQGRGKSSVSLLGLTSEEFYSYLTEIAKHYMDTVISGDFYFLNPIDSLLVNIPDKGASCWSGNCLETMITINPDGTVSTCPDLAVERELILGNIITDSIENIMFNMKRISGIKRQKTFTCNCRYLNVCHGGCPHHFYGADGNECRKFFSALFSIKKEYGDFIEKNFRILR